MQPSSLSLLISLRMALSRSSLTTSTIICLTCCGLHGFQKKFLLEDPNPNNSCCSHIPRLPDRGWIEHGDLLWQAASSSSLCGWWTSCCCCCQTLRKAGSVIPRRWRKEEEFETAVEKNFTRWRELEVEIAATVGPSTQTTRIFRPKTWKKALIRAAAAIVFLIQADCSSPHPESKPQTSCSHRFTYWNLSHPNLRWHKLLKIIWSLVGLLLNSKALYPQKVQGMHKQMWTQKENQDNLNSSNKVEVVLLKGYPLPQIS